ncbi:MAG: GAF domain-containing protein, partial [Deltaproteobacteria bacterium]|nr:GAF domain-containing protein [Deltaproteobacteria bacterium]
MQRSRQSADRLSQSQEIASLRAELATEHEKLLAIQDISLAAGSSLDIDELLSVVADRISRIMECERTTIYLLDEKGGFLVSKVAQGEERIEFCLPMGTGLAGWTAKTGVLLNLPNAYDDPRFDREWDKKTGY